jgi:hypothetical protein
MFGICITVPNIELPRFISYFLLLCPWVSYVMLLVFSDVLKINQAMVLIVNDVINSEPLNVIVCYGCA